MFLQFHSISPCPYISYCMIGAKKKKKKKIIDVQDRPVMDAVEYGDKAGQISFQICRWSFFIILLVLFMLFLSSKSSMNYSAKCSCPLRSLAGPGADTSSSVSDTYF